MPGRDSLLFHLVSVTRSEDRRRERVKPEGITRWLSGHVTS